MDTTPRCEAEDIIINFRDLFVHILRRWRSILVGVLVVTLLLAGFKYLKDQKAYENALAAAKEHAATVQLDDASRANAEQVMQYQKLYDAQVAYNCGSLLMSIDPTAVPTQTLSYLISGEQAYAVAAVYQTHVNSRELYTALADADTMMTDPSYVAELVTSWLQSDNGADAIANHVILNIKIIAPSKELCADIARGIKQQMNAVKTPAANIGAHTLRLIADTHQLTVDNGLKTTQQNNLGNATTLRNNLKSAKDALTGNEKAYIEQMSTLDEEQNAAAPTPPSVSKKMVVLGIAVGLVLMAGLHALGYVFSRKVKSREDFAERYGLYVFGGIVADGKKPSLTERCLRRVFFKNAVEDVSLAEQQLLLSVKAALDDKTPASVLVIGSAIGDNATELFAPLKEAMAKQGITFDILPCALTDATAFERLATADVVVLAETVGASAYGDIYREIEMCERLKRPVLGAFILQ